MLPNEIIEAWKMREGPVVFATVSPEGMPNAIYASCAEMSDGCRIVIADNFFDKTKKNLDSGCKGSVVFITKERKSYQIKGNIEYHTSGDIFDDMKKWLKPDLPGKAAAVIIPFEVYRGSERLL